MPKKPLSYVLMILTVIFAFFSWRSVHQAIFSQGASDFWTPLTWFSLFAIALCLLIVLVQEKISSRLAFVVALSVSFIFVQSFFHLVVVAVAWVLFFFAQKSIQDDINASIKIQLTKNLQRGIFMVVVALVLMISSQYYLSVRNSDSTDIAPSISKGGTASSVIKFVLPMISPEFKQVSSDEIDVDEFLGEIYETIIRREGEELKNKLESGTNSIQSDQAEKIIESELGRKLTEDEKNQIETFKMQTPTQIASVSPQIKQEVVSQWKKELSKTAGMEIRGDEKVVDVFVVIVNSKIDELAELKEGEEKSKILPLIFAIVLFLTLMSLGSFISRFWTMIAAGIFWTLRRFGLVKIEIETKEAEVIR